MVAFLVPAMRLPGPVLIDRTAGSNIGNMTASGGLAAAFNGNTNQANGACAAFASTSAGYCGKTLARPMVFAAAITYGSNDHGYWPNYNGSLTISIYGKQGSAPANATNGTLVASAQNFTDGLTTDPRTFLSNDLSTAWDHLWATISGGSDVVGSRLAELELYEWV